MRFGDLQSWLDWQETLHPSEIELGLERIQRVWNSVCPAGLKATVVTVAGTNGKGSSCAMLESIYIAAGYDVGCYTSPHFIRYTERIHIQGVEVDEAVLCQAFETIDQARGDVSLTYFEFSTLAALLLFSQVELDIVILEVGLGGRLDAVNIIDADVALLVSVGLDHQDWLGNSLDEIGFEKAGVFRQGRPAICAESSPPESVIQYANDIGANCLIQGRDFKVLQSDVTWSWSGLDAHTRYSLPAPALRGAIQIQNASAVLMVLQSLEDRLPVDQNQLRQGLLSVSIPGRFEVVAGDIPIILDVAHNPAAAEVLCNNLTARGCSAHTHAIFGMLADKDIASVMKIMNATITDWQLVPIQAARGADVEQLSKHLSALGHENIGIADTVQQAITQTLQKVQAGDQIVIFGSFYVVADALKCLHA